MPLTLRLVKGSELTYAELDDNFTFITGSFTPLSITSSMSVATASNITPAIASNGNDRIITSDGDGTVTAEANFTFNGSTARITGSLIVSGANGGINTNLGFPALFQNDGVGTVIFGNGKLWLNDSGGTSVDWGTRYLLDSVGGTSVDWENRLLSDTSGVDSINWENRRLHDSTSVTAVSYNTRTLTDNIAKTAMIWTNATRSLYDVNASASIDWANRQLRGEQPSGVSYVKIDYSTAYSTTIQSVSGSGATATTASIVVSNNHNTSDDGGILLSSYLGTQGSTLAVGKAVDINGTGGLRLRAGSSFQITASAGFNPTLFTYLSSSYFAPVTFNDPVSVNNQITVVGSPSYVVLTTVSQSLNFANDTAAAAGGIPLGGLYRNGSFIMIRMS